MSRRSRLTRFQAGFCRFGRFRPGVRLAIVPRGLDPTPWLQQMRMQKSGGPSDWEELRKKLGGRTVFVGVDSISANSGIPHKMVAFRHFLQEHPEYINKVVFVQAAITDSTVRRFPSWQVFAGADARLWCLKPVQPTAPCYVASACAGA